MKYDSEGEVQWFVPFRGSGEDWCDALAIDDDSGGGGGSHGSSQSALTYTIGTTGD